MNDFEDQNQPAQQAEEQDVWDEVEISDLSSEKRSHHLLFSWQPIKSILRPVSKLAALQPVSLSQELPDHNDALSNDLEAVPDHDDALSNDFTLALSDLPPTTPGHYALQAFYRIKHHVLPFRRLLETHSAAVTQRLPDKDEATPDDFDITISDLPPLTHQHQWLLKLQASQQRLRFFLRGQRRRTVAQSTPGLTRHARRARVSQILMVTGLVSVLALLLLGNIPTLRSNVISFLGSPISTPTPSPQPFSRFQGFSRIYISGQSSSIGGPAILGDVPTTCPNNDELQENATTIFGVPALSIGPLWFIGFAGPSAALIQLTPALFREGTTMYWYAPVTLFLPRGSTGQIALQGGDQLSPIPLMLSDTRTPEKTSYQLQQSLNPGSANASSTGSGSWETVPFNIFIPAAGCYFLKASWGSNTWMAYFAAGMNNL